MPRSSYVPFAAFVFLIVFLGFILCRPQSAIVWNKANQVLPDFSMKDDRGVTFTPADLKDDINGVYLINFFASWCPPCQVEHKHLLSLANDKKIPIVGVNYKDTAKDRTVYLNKFKNPYTHILIDEKGFMAIPFGLSGLPETFVVKGDKIIARYKGPLTDDAVLGLESVIK